MREIVVYADVACPFTHAGLRRLVEERSIRGRDDDLRFRVRAWPLERVNGHPLDPMMVAAEVEALRAAVVPDLFAGFDPLKFPRTSMPALALTAAAYLRSVDLGEAAALALRDALFEQGRDVADPDELARIAADLDMAASHGDSLVLEEYEAGTRLGVRGSPHFLVGESGFFCPAMDVSHDEGGFHVAFAEGRFAEFCDRVFG